MVAEHYVELYRYAYRLTGSAADAEDLVQQAFLQAQRKLSQVREPGKARGWLFAVLRSCHGKACRRKRPVPAADVGLEVDQTAGNMPAADRLETEDLQQALDQLSEEHKTILLLFYFEEQSYKEIAAQLEIPLGTVMSRLSRAKSLLRTALTDGEADTKPRSPR